MKHLKLFGNANELQTYVNGSDYLEPFVGTDSQGGGVKYNRVVENIIRVFVEQSDLVISKFLDNDLSNYEDVELKEGWNTLDMTNDFKYGFGNIVGTSLNYLTEVDFSHYIGTKLYMYMFFQTGLKKVILSDSIKEIQEGCFVNNNNLQEVILNKNIAIIGNSAFNNCRKLTKCILPEGLKELQDGSFLVVGLEKLILPESIEKLGENVYSCYNDDNTVSGTVRFHSLEPPIMSKYSFNEHITLEVPMAAVETYKNVDIPGWKEKFGDKIVGY